jgi:CheY-like chemotaxis protein
MFLCTRRQTMRVLIVEDEALIATCLEALVVSFGYEVCALAASAPEAVENAAIHMPMSSSWIFD